MDLAQVFHFPVLNFVDNPGFIIGKNAEKDGTIKYGAKALASMYQFKNPMCSIILRKVFGVAGAAHTNHMNFKFRFAWPLLIQDHCHLKVGLRLLINRN